MNGRQLAILAASLCLSGAARGEIYYVDDSGGPHADFTDLPPAVDAAVPGDVIYVLGGDYSATELDEGLRIIGLGTAAVRIHGLRVHDLPEGQVAEVVGAEPFVAVQLFDLVVEDCLGTVVLDNVWMRQEAPFVGSPGGRVTGSADVRIFRSSANPGPGADVGAPALGVADSRVELVELSAAGWVAPPAPCFPEDGTPAVLLAPGTRAVVVQPISVAGGHGGTLTQNCNACTPPGSSGDGAPAIDVRASAQLILTGTLDGSFLSGGARGGTGFPGCAGDCGPALRVAPGASVRWAGVDLALGAGCPPQTPLIEGPALQEPSIPFLTLTQPPAPGASARFVVWGEPGDTVELVLGSRPLLRATPGVEVERLVAERRRIVMGTIASDGNVSVLLPVPLHAHVDAPLYAQAEVFTGAGLVRTNSQVLFLP